MDLKIESVLKLPVQFPDYIIISQLVLHCPDTTFGGDSLFKFTFCSRLFNDAVKLLTYVNFKYDFTPRSVRYWLFGKRLFGFMLVKSSIEGPKAAPTFKM